MLVHIFPKSAYVCAKSLQSYLTLCDPMDCSLPGSSDQGIFQARTLEWVALPSSRGSSWCRDWTWVSLCLLHWQAGSIPLAPPETLQNLWRQIYCCYSALKSSPTLQPHGLQLTRFPCLSPSPWVCSNSCPLSWWCYPNISASVAPSLSTLSLSVHQVFSKELALCIRWPKYWSPLTSVLPMNIQCCIPCCPRDSQESSPAPQFEESVLRCSAFFMVQHSHPCITTGKTIALTIRTFAGKI